MSDMITAEEAQALRDRADGWRASSDEGWRLVEVIKTDRDRLAAANAALEAKVARLVGASDVLGGWMSAALEDPKVSAEMKADVNAWFAALAEVQGDARREGGEWKGPGEAPHRYSPDPMAMGDCFICGHTREAHE